MWDPEAPQMLTQGNRHQQSKTCWIDRAVLACWGPVTFPKAAKTKWGAVEDNRCPGRETWHCQGGCCRRTVERLLCLESAAAELFLQAIPEAPSWDMGRCLRATAPHPAVTRHRAAKLPLEPVASLMALPAKTACQAVPRRQCWAQSQQCQSIHHCQPYLGAVLTVGYSRSPRDMGPPRGGEQREGRAGGSSE